MFNINMIARSVRLLFALALATFGVAAQAQTATSFDVAGQALKFTGSGTCTGGTAVNSYCTYANIITIGGQQINAKITLVSISGATLDTWDSTANPYSLTDAFQPNLTIGTVGGYAEFRIDFTNSSGSPVTLNNFYINTYDLDGSGQSASGRQFTDFKGFISYNLSSTTLINVKTVGSYTRFVTTIGGNRTDTVGSSDFNDIRARVFYGSASSVSVRVGDEAATGTAYFSLQLSKGYEFANAAPSLATTKTLSQVNGSAYVAGTPIKSGDVLTYAITVKETGLAAEGSTTLVETAPATTTYTGSGEGWVLSAGEYSQNVTVAAGGTVTKNFTVTVGALADNDAAIANTVTSTSGTCTSCTVSTQTVPRLSITKTPPASLLAGGSASYSVVISNLGGSATSGLVSFTDTLPTGLTFGSQTAGNPGMVCTNASQVITCSGSPNIAAGSSHTVTYTVNVASNASGAPVNSVVLTNLGGDPRTPANDAIDPTAGNSTQGSDKLSAKAAQSVTVITPVTESGSAAAGTASTAIADVRSNDTINGAPATATNSTISTSGTWPAGITLNTTSGAINVAATVPAGSYNVTYQLCDKATPANCVTMVDTITVGSAITADADSVSGINGASGQANALDVLAGDTLNGTQVTLSQVNLTVTTAANAINGGPVPSLDAATGKVSVPAGTPAGSYTITYKICEKLNPTNCASNTATIAVSAAAVVASDDSATGVNGLTGQSGVVNAFTSDTINGAAASSSNATLALASGSSVPTGLTFNTATGAVDVAAGTAAGTYSFDYTLCEKLNPTNCDTATISVTVSAAAISADADTPPAVNSAVGGTGIINVFANDTLNGSPVDPKKITASVTTPAKSIDGGGVPVLNVTTGLVDVPVGVPAGSYTIEYQICEELNPTNCATSTVTVVVEPARSNLSGTVYTDVNGDRNLDSGDIRRVGWIVEVKLDDTIVGTTTTDAQGNYTFTVRIR